MLGTESLNRLSRGQTAAHALFNAIITHRRKGNTTAMLRGVYETPTIIVAADAKHREWLQRQASGVAYDAGVKEERLDGPEKLRPQVISVHQLPQALLGAVKPLVLDLHTVGVVLNDIVHDVQMMAAESLMHRADAERIRNLLLTKVGIRVHPKLGLEHRRPMEQLEEALDELAALRREAKANREALKRWGTWCHTEGGHSEEAGLFEAAVEGTPAWAFPKEDT